MSDSRNKKIDDEISLEIPALEEPPPPEAAGHGITPIFPEDSLASLSAKVMVMEALLHTVVRDASFNDFMREVLLAIMRAVKCEAGSILEVDESKKCLFFRSVVGQSSDQLTKFTIPVGQGIVGYVAESRLPLVVNDASENQLRLRAVGDAVGFNPRNIVALPILIRGKVFGVLELLNRVGEDTFTKADVELLTFLADSAARVIEVRMIIAWAAQGRRAA